MLMPIPGMGNINILKEVNKMTIGLLAHGLALRISQEENTSFLQKRVMDTKQQLPQLETYNKVRQQIKEALNLDLNELQEFKRGTWAPILIQKRRQENKEEWSITVNTSIRLG